MKYCPECMAVFERRVVDGVERLMCSATDCNYVVWDNPVPVVAGLVIYRDQLLLARNSRWPAGMFSMITGYLERHEEPATAIARETREELGLEAREIDFIGHYPFTAKNQIIMAFAIKAEGDIRLNEEISEIELLDLEQVREKDFARLAVTARIVKDWLQQLGSE